jgi:hypothetical protein
MLDSSVDVLLISRSKGGVSGLLRFLEQRGCHCLIVSHAEALNLARVESFDLILSTRPLRQSGPLVRKLDAAPCQIFYEFGVEDGCWWVPLEGEKRKRLGSPALRSSEFAEFLERTIKEIRARRPSHSKAPAEGGEDPTSDCPSQKASVLSA